MNPPSNALQLHRLPKTTSLCADYLYFRQLLARSRSYHDDNISQRLNAINTQDPHQCRQFKEALDRLHSDRREKLLFCIEQLKRQLDAEPAAMVLRKELSLLDSELTVEDLACEQSSRIFREKCRQYY